MNTHRSVFFSGALTVITPYRFKIADRCGLIVPAVTIAALSNSGNS